MTPRWSSADLALAAEAVSLLAERGETVATAESLTGGLVVAALTDIPGASAVVRGGIVAYAADVKTSALGVSAELLSRHGAVHGEVAEQMASGAARVLAASFGVATTGVAGPDLADGQPVGTVHIAVSGPHGITHRALSLSGGRAAIRLDTVREILNLLVSALREANS